MYKDTDVYPYDQDIDFTIDIDNNQQFLEKIDRQTMNQELETLRDANNAGELLPSRLNRLETLEELDDVLTQFENGDINSINMKLYRELVFITTAHFFIFHLSINILRLIGGYGALAYSGNN